MKKSNKPLKVKVIDRKTGRPDYRKQVDINSNNILSAGGQEDAEDFSARALDYAVNRPNEDSIDRAFSSGYKAEYKRRGKERK
tara:strand:- start:1361 stop:1609 length:249 start_codon:yes stop_codon:yes gene_type:complete